MATRPYQDFYFSEYAPDFGGAPRAENPAYLTDCVNLRPTPNGYRGAPSFADIASATAIGAVSTNTARGYYATHWEILGGSGLYVDTPLQFVMNSAGSIFISSDFGVTWTDVTAAGTASNAYGDFVLFGETVIYVSSARAAIKKDISAAYTFGAVFTALGGSPPIAMHAARIRDHLVLGQLKSSDPYGIRWSAIGNSADWPTPGTSDALAKEAGTQSLNSNYGRVEELRGGEKFGVIWQIGGLTRMTYVGGSTVYEFDTFEKKIGLGTTTSGSPVSDGTLWYWYNKSGMFATDGYSVNKLSLGKADAALFARLISHPLASSVESTIHGAYYPTQDKIIWGVGVYTGTQYQLTYSPRSGSIGFESGTTLMALYEAKGGLSVDPAVYNVNGTSRKLQRLTGATGSIALQTGYIELDPGYKTQITGAHLLGAGVPGSLALAYKSTSSLASVDVVQTGFTTMTAAPRGMKATGRATEQFHAFRITGTGSEAQLIRGIRVYFERGEPAT